MVQLRPSNVLPSGSWGTSIRFRVLPPSNGAWFWFNLEVAYFQGSHVRLYENVKDDSTFFRRMWHRLARPWRGG